MPIATCYINDLEFSETQLENLTNEWTKEIEADLKDICLTFIKTTLQTGQKYKVMVNLFLPSLWGKSSMDHIQNSLLNQLVKHLKIKASSVFIITNIVQSGNVVENGVIVKWDE